MKKFFLFVTCLTLPAAATEDCLWGSAIHGPTQCWDYEAFKVTPIGSRQVITKVPMIIDGASKEAEVKGVVYVLDLKSYQPPSKILDTQKEMEDLVRVEFCKPIYAPRGEMNFTDWKGIFKVPMGFGQIEPSGLTLKYHFKWRAKNIPLKTDDNEWDISCQSR